MKVKPNQAAPFAVTLSATAPAGGATVTLKSSDTSKVVVNPASVVIPEGATTPATQPQVTGVGIGAATITAIATGYTSGASVVTVTPPTMSFSGSPLVIATVGSGKLTLNLSGGQAPAGGLTVGLHSSDTSKATVPGTVSFAPGATSVTVPVTGVTPGTTTITASASNIASATAAVTVTPPPTVTASYDANFLQVINVVLTNTSGVTAVNLRITSITNVTAIAPNVIGLRPNVIIPMPYGNLAGGQAVARNFTFIATAGSIEVPFSFVVTYEADNMPPQTAVIDVPFPRSMNFSGSPLAINAGASGTLTLKLLGNQAPAAGLIVNLSSTDPSRAAVPATVSFAAGATSVAVPVTGIAPGSAVITAKATVVNFPALATAAVNVTGAIKSPANTPVRLGQSAPFTVTLPAPAPAGGVTVTLKSSDASRVTVTPASVVIPQGATVPATQPQVTGAGIGSATITAAATGYISGAGAVTVTPPTMSFTGSPLVITAGESGKLTLTLSGGQAPVGGLTLNLNSSDTSKATVSGTISLAAGATSVTVSVAAVAPGTATITASGPNIATATASVTVTGTIKSPANTSVNLGQSTSFAVTLSAPAPAGGVTLTLKSSDTSKVTVTPANVIIPQGATKPATQPQVTGAGIGAATITATATGYTSNTGTVTVTAPTMIFTDSPLVVAFGGSGKLTLTLSGGQTPAGGLTVNLNSSDTSKATVPATVSFAPGATSVTVSVAAVAPGAVKINASASNIASATAAVTITGAINLPANTPMKLGQSASLAVTLSAPAPLGGVTVNLKTNDDGSKVIVTPVSVIIPQGATTPTTQPQVRGAGIGSVTITAAATGFTSGTGTVTVAAPTMAFTGSPPSIVAGGVVNLTLTLTSGQAPAGGLTVSLNSSDTSKATVPRTVNFTAGAPSVTVPVTGIALGTTTITASAPNIVSAVIRLTVIQTPPTVTVTAAFSARSLERINVVLTNTSGVTAVNLRIVNITEVTAVAPNVIAPRGVFQASDTLAGGQASVAGVTFEARAGRLDVPFRFTITYEADNMPVRTAVIDVPFLQAMSFAGGPLEINAGASGNLTLNLTGTKAPAGGLTVNLNSSDTSKATVPRTVSFTAGATSVSVPVAAISAGTTTITASAPGLASATASVTVSPPPTVTASYGANFLQLIDVGLVNTSRVTAINLRITRVTNVTAAKPNVIALRPNVIIPMPYGNVAGGQGTTRSFTFEAVAGSIEVPFSFTVTCEADNMPPQTAVIDVPFPRSMNFSESPLAMRAGDPGKLTLNLLGNQAPAGGLVVNLNSSDPKRASVPATVSFPPGATSVTVPVAGLAPGSVTITATATVRNFPATATAIVNVGGGRDVSRV
ncbi:MAG: hypothetical protein QOH41_2495 [Blastocatellia bacterium]|nr:hypothetical protein [Blastocatellia bacterium]